MCKLTEDNLKVVWAEFSIFVMYAIEQHIQAVRWVNVDGHNVDCHLLSLTPFHFWPEVVSTTS